MEPATPRSTPAQREWIVNREWLWVSWTVLLSIIVLAMAGHNLGNFPPISGDAAWIMSASHKLATEGVFGSNMLRGFANGDRHYFIALPVYHFLQASVFSLFGTGVAQARALTLGSGLVILWCTAWLARHWFGIAVAITATGLLVFWRTHLMDVADGLSFISVSRTGRYDATGVAFILLTLVIVERLFCRDDRRLAVLAGIVAGVATLTQFFGLFVIPLVASALLIYRRYDVLWRLVIGWLVVVVPYMTYVGIYWNDFVAQSELKSGRIEFDDPAFFFHNLSDEPDRYQHLFGYLVPAFTGQHDSFDTPLSPFFFGVASITALTLLAVRVRKHKTHGDRMLALSIAVLGFSLALLDGTNAKLYAVILLPLLCIAIAHMLVSALRWASSQRFPLLRLGASLVIVVPTVVVVQEGIIAHRQEYEWSTVISDYSDVATEISALLPEDARVLGTERWWAGLYREHRYMSITAIAQQWKLSRSPTGDRTNLNSLLADHHIGAIVIDIHARNTISNLPAPLRRQFDDLITDRGEHAGTVLMHPYGEIDVYTIDSTT